VDPFLKNEKKQNKKKPNNSKINFPNRFGFPSKIPI
jgi:hypothetical protein